MTRQDIPTSSQPNAIDGKIGYKHPPVKSQFRKGQSGNPRGRRKGQRNLTPVLIDVLRQTVKVKQGGNAQRMSKGEALIQILLSKAQNGDGRAIKAVLLVTERIARIDAPELKFGGHGDYGFMLVPGVSTSSEEWQWDISIRYEMAALRETIAAARAAGISLTTSQKDALREFIAAARAARTPLTTSQIAALTDSIGLTRAAKASPTVTRRAVNRKVLSSVKPDTAEQSNSEAATPAQTPADQTVAPTLPTVSTVARTGTYRKVNRQLPTPPPTTTPNA
jgi:hypothetical protein